MATSTRTTTVDQHTYSFTLVLSGFSDLSSEVEDALYGGGCNDALLGTRDRVPFLDFDRKERSFLDAVLSAIEDVRRAGYEVLRVEPDDLVSAAEIARRTGRSPQSVHQLIVGDRGCGGFPPPISTLKGTSPLWRWVDVVEWLREHKANPGAEGDPATNQFSVENARVIASINDVLDLRRHGKAVELQEKIFKHLMPTRPRKVARGISRQIARTTRRKAASRKRSVSTSRAKRSLRPRPGRIS